MKPFDWILLSFTLFFILAGCGNLFLTNPLVFKLQPELYDIPFRKFKIAAVLFLILAYRMWG